MVLKGRDYGFIGLKLKDLIFYENGNSSAHSAGEHSRVERLNNVKRWTGREDEDKEWIANGWRNPRFAALQAL